MNVTASVHCYKKWYKRCDSSTLNHTAHLHFNQYCIYWNHLFDVLNY